MSACSCPRVCPKGLSFAVGCLKLVVLEVLAAMLQNEAVN